METEDNNLLAANDESMKHEYEGEMEHKLRDLGKRIDELIDKADASKALSIETLKLKKAEADSSLQKLKVAGQEAWSELKRGMDLAWNDLHSAWNELSCASDKARAKFNK